MSMNPFCEITVEEALRLREAGAAAEVVGLVILGKQVQSFFTALRALGHEDFNYGCPVFIVQRPDSALLGAALRAAHGWLCNEEESFVPISCLYEGNLEKTSLGSKLAVPARDTEEDTELLKKYTLLMRKRMEIERRLVEKIGRA